MNLEHLRKALALQFTPKIGNVKGKDILLDPEKSDLISCKEPEICKKIDAILKSIEKHNAKAVTLLDEDYPENLKEIYDPPLVLYYYGNIQTSVGIGVVGTRYPSKYGENSCQKIVKELSLYPVEIISGFANGIDTIAHKESVKNNCRTFAVMGCGLDYNYPASNKNLRDEILEKDGALISEYSFGTPPEAFRFPSRNRIISGLSSAVVVIEASEESGAIITAKTANDQGRTVFTVPGSLFIESFSGNHALIRQGATLIRSAHDILNDLSVFQEKKPKIRTSPSVEKKIPNLNEEEKLIFQLIQEPISLDPIVAQTGFPPARILGILTQLILKNLILEKGGFYQKT